MLSSVPAPLQLAKDGPHSSKPLPPPPRQDTSAAEPLGETTVTYSVGNGAKDDSAKYNKMALKPAASKEMRSCSSGSRRRILAAMCSMA